MNELPLACNLNAIPADERTLHGQRWGALLQRLQQATPIDEGYRLWFPADNATLQLLMTVIANERLCCPFLSITIELAPAASDISLILSGPTGTRALLASELGLA